MNGSTSYLLHPPPSYACGAYLWRVWLGSVRPSSWDHPMMGILLRERDMENLSAHGCFLTRDLEASCYVQFNELRIARGYRLRCTHQWSALGFHFVRSIARIALAYELGSFSIVISPAPKLSLALFAVRSTRHVLVLPYLALTMRRRWSYQSLALLYQLALAVTILPPISGIVLSRYRLTDPRPSRRRTWTRRSAERINGAVESRADAITFAGSCKAGGDLCSRGRRSRRRDRHCELHWSVHSIFERKNSLKSISGYALCEYPLCICFVSARYIGRTYVNFLDEDKRENLQVSSGHWRVCQDAIIINK